MLLGVPAAAHILDPGPNSVTGWYGSMASASPGGDCLRVLIVDDNQDAANALSILLGLWGHSVAVAYSGTTAIKLAESFDPQVALLDIWMPGMHGGEVARHFRQSTALKDALIIAVTAHPLNDSRLDEWREYFDDVLSKPCNLAQLEDLLAAHAASGR